MLERLRSWFKSKKQLGADNEKLLRLYDESCDQREGLTRALGEQSRNYDVFRGEVNWLLSAIAIQHGGELEVSKEALQVARENEAAVDVQSDEEGNYSIKLTEGGEAQ